MIRRPLRVLLLAAVVAPTLAACGSANRDDISDVRGAMAATAPLAHRFVYSETTADTDFAVEGLVEDDFRYKAQLAIDGRPAYVEAVQDDAIAARVLSDEGEELYGSVGDRGWVLDGVGAPDLTSTGDRDRGEDPVLDALEVFSYIGDVMLRENVIVKYVAEDYEYRAAEDPFDTPEEGSGVVRYDIRPPRLPKASDGIAGNQPVPDQAHFRRAAIYVKDGLVVRVEELIDIESRLDEIEDTYDIEFPSGASTDDKVRISVAAINAVRRGQGLDPIRPRAMRFDLLDLGDDIEVELPTGTTEGDVSPLRFRGADDLRPEANRA